MPKIFQDGSQVDILNKHFKQGQSLTHDEAILIKINRLAQRMQDLKKKYEEYAEFNPIRVVDEPNGRGGVHARYFFAGSGCSLEKSESVRVY
ncbi:MAG: hypothetical protein COA44_06105 [Arcobacter sp.]|nr:MAG: hypothetical protein COA44_06105 [Arcobacter sp.]